MARPISAALDIRGSQQRLFLSLKTRMALRCRMSISNNREAHRRQSYDDGRILSARIAKLPELLKQRRDGLDTDEAGGATPGFPA